MQRKEKVALGLLTVSMLIVGLSTVLLLKSYMEANKAATAPEASLPNLLQLELENEQLAKGNEKLWTELRKLQSSQSSVAQTSEQLDSLSLKAGLLPLSGPGIVIILDDSQFDREMEYGNYVIHEEYIRTLVNILWNGGAEAIAVNNQRISSHTEIFCSGAYIQINGTRQMPPYNIVAIGNQEHLKAALQFYFWDKLGQFQQQYGITRTLDIPETPLTVPGAVEKVYQHAQPAKEG